MIGSITAGERVAEVVDVATRESSVAAWEGGEGGFCKRYG